MKFVFFGINLLFSLASFAQTDPETENIFIITTDGFRWQEVFTGADSTLIHDSRYVSDPSLIQQMYWDPSPEIRRKKLMPFLWTTIATQGQLYGNRLFQNKVNVANAYKISYPGYNEMLTGYADPVFIPNIPVRNRNINILEYLNSRKEYAGKVAAFSSWNIFSAILNKKRNHFPINSGYEETPGAVSINNEMINETQNEVQNKTHNRYDLLTFLSAREYIEKNNPRIVLIGFGETDEFAHCGRYDLYLQQAANVDKMIAEFWYYIQSDPHYRNKTTFIVTTDHGRGKNPSAWHNHGPLTKGSGETWFALIGPGIAPNGEMKSIQQHFQKQIASTIALLMGEPFDPAACKPNAILFQRTPEYQTAFLKETFTLSK